MDATLTKIIGSIPPNIYRSGHGNDGAADIFLGRLSALGQNLHQK